MKSTVAGGDPDRELSGVGEAPRLTPGDWVWRAFLAVLVTAFGLLVAGLGPLLAISCNTCQDGVRNPRYDEALMTLAWRVVPLVTLSTVMGLFLPRAGFRVGWIGAGLLVVLLAAILTLGQIPV
ncbi:hypothetical protein ACQB60_31925 [Actinomycetota bacterium Odt1-20B]